MGGGEDLLRAMRGASPRELSRLRAVSLAVSGGLGPAEAARRSGLSVHSVRRWLRAYRDGGAPALAPRSPGSMPPPGAAAALPPPQAVGSSTAAHPDPGSERAQRLSDAGDVDGAVREYAAHLRRRPHSAGAAGAAGGVLLGAGRAAEAAWFYERAVRADPSLAAARAGLGMCLEKAGRWEEALGCYEQALACSARSLSAQYNLGYAYMRAGRYAEAADRMEDALALDHAYVMERLSEEATPRQMELMASSGRRGQRPRLESTALWSGLLGESAELAGEGPGWGPGPAAEALSLLREGLPAEAARALAEELAAGGPAEAALAAERVAREAGPGALMEMAAAAAPGGARQAEALAAELRAALGRGDSRAAAEAVRRALSGGGG